MSGQVNLSVCLWNCQAPIPGAPGAPGLAPGARSASGSDLAGVPGTSENHWRRQDSTQKLKMTSVRDFLCRTAEAQDVKRSFRLDRHIWRPREEGRAMLYKRSEQSRAVPGGERPPFRTWTSLQAEAKRGALRPCVFPLRPFSFLGSIRRETRTNKMARPIQDICVWGWGNRKV